MIDFNAWRSIPTIFIDELVMIRNGMVVNKKLF
jgi:hypothetical protein